MRNADSAAGRVRFESEGAIVTITIEGSDELNSITPDMFVELHRCLVAFDDDSSLRVAILRGAGDQNFSRGEDAESADGARPLAIETILKQFWSPHLETGSSPWAAWDTVFSRRTVKPVIAAIQGDCLGAGLMICALHSDVRIAGTSARFGLPEALLGSWSGAGSASRLADQIPYVALTWMLETAQPIDAVRAQEWFLVTEVVADDAVFQRAREIAELAASRPPAAVRAEKLGLIHLSDVPYEDAAMLAAGLRALAAPAR